MTTHNKRLLTLGVPMSLASIVVVVMAAVLYAGHKNYEKELVDAFQRHQLAIARSVAGAIKEVISEVLQDLRYLTSDPDIVNGTGEIRDQLKRYYEVNGDVYNDISVVDSDGSLIYRVPEAPGTVNVADRPEFRTGQDTGRVVIGDTRPCAVDGEGELCMFAPIRRRDRFAAGVYACVSLEKLWAKSIASVQTELEGSFWVVDGKGVILYGPKPQYTGKNWARMEYDGHTSMATSEGHGHEHDAHEPTFVDRAIRGEQGVTTCCNVLTGGTENLIVFTPIPMGEVGYSLIATVDKTRLTAPIARNLRLNYGLIAGLVLLFLVSGYTSYRSAKTQMRLEHERRYAAERQQAEDDIRRAKKAAEAANQSKSEFLANMSHEIRTPMTSILGFTENLLDPDLSEADRLSTIHTVHRNGANLLAIINDILDLSKVEAGRLEVERIPVDPCKIVAEVASLVRVQADCRGLSFDIEYIGPVPKTIRTDPTRLRQILTNLTSNAIKFTEVGGVRLITRLIDDADEPSMQFDVVDSGVGLTAKEADRLFQPFTQADSSTTRKFGGTGLGLTISKRLAEMLGGDITVVDSRVGVGTRFRVTIAAGPLDGVKMIEDPLSATVVARDAARALTGTNELGLGNRRILLVEDGLDNQRLIGHVLRKAGAEVIIVENGKLAIDAALAARNGEAGGPGFDVILMDMQMPVMDGYEATGQLREMGYTDPIIALTAHAMEGDREKCLEAGCNDYVTKPIDRRKLIEIVRTHFRPAAASALP